LPLHYVKSIQKRRQTWTYQEADRGQHLGRRTFGKFAS